MRAVTRRHLIIAALVIVAVNATIALVGYVAPGPSGKPSSSLATAPGGFAAWAELARRNGVRVVALRRSLHEATLPEGATVVALDAPRMSRRDAAALRAFAQDGGRVLAGGRRPERWLDVLDPDVRWNSVADVTARRTAVIPETDGVETVQTAGTGGWTGREGALTAGDDALLVSRRVGSGRINLLADASPLQNRRLDEADNAALALALAGPGPLIFAESVHGYGESTGLAALPDSAKGALVLLLVAAGLMMLARGRRFGPVEPEARELAPPRVAYVDALGAKLARTKDHDAAMAPVREALVAAGVQDLGEVRDHQDAIDLAQQLKDTRR